MKKTGNLLREAREAKGITLQEVSLHLKINTKVLKSIEDGDLNALPARTFLRGFVQSYGSYLKVDSKMLIEIFLEEMGIAHPGMIIHPEPQELPKPEEKPKFTEPKKTSTPVPPVAPTLSVDPKAWSQYVKVGLVVFVILIVILIVGVKKTIEKYERETVISENTPVAPSENIIPSDPILGQNFSTQAPLTPAEVPESKETKPEDKSSVPTQKIPATSQAPVVDSPKKVEPSTPAPTMVVTATPIVTQEPVAPKKEDQVTPENPQEVILEALDKVNIEYTIDDGTKKSMTLGAEKVHTFKAKRKIVLIVSDGGSINIIHNGKDKGVPGNLGQPLKTVYPSESN